MMQSSNRITGSKRWWALTAVLITMFFSSMDQTVVSTAMPSIIGQLHGLSLYSWVFTAYMMASAVSVPIYGKLSDTYGRKPFYAFGLGVFIVGSAISGQAHSMMALVAARAGQGIGAGAMMSMPRATIGDIFNPRERGRWMGIIGGVFGLASIIGPTLGGWITDTFGWRWVFYINLPIAALALILVLLTLPSVRTAHVAHVDWAGITLLIVGLMPILLGFTWAGTQYAWTSWEILGLMAFGVVVLAGFVWVEFRNPDAVLSPRLFSNPTFSSSILVQLFISMGLFGALMYLPLYAQGVLGLSAAASGAVMTPMMLAFIGSSVLGGQLLTKTGQYKLQAHISALVMAVGMYMLMGMTVSTGYGTVILNVVVMGVGVGALMPLLNVAVQNAFPYEVMGTVNATQQFASSLGGVIAAPILGTLMTRTFSAKLPILMPPTLKAALGRLPAPVRHLVSNPEGLTNAQAQSALALQFSRFGRAGLSLYHAFILAVKGALAAGMHELFLAAFLFSLAALAGTFVLKEIPLRSNEYFNEDGKEVHPPSTHLVITVSAAYGAGGSLIAPRLAERLDLSFINRLITGVGLQIGQSSPDVDEDVLGISGSDRLVTSLAHDLTLSGVNVPLTPDGTVQEDELRRQNEEAMWKAAAEHGAVILGRGGAVVFQAHPQAFHIRLVGATERRRARVAERRGLSEAEATAEVARVDAARESYVRHFYHQDPTRSTLYHLVVDTTVMEPEQAVDLILTAVAAWRSSAEAKAGPSREVIPAPS